MKNKLFIPDKRLQNETYAAEMLKKLMYQLDYGKIDDRTMYEFAEEEQHMLEKFLKTVIISSKL